MVYYDCRDVAFDDVGFSPRMVEAVLSEVSGSGVLHDLTSLSDVLAWLLVRDFQVSICVDEGRSRLPGVKDFLARLARIGGDNLEIVTKEVAGGVMHKKALVTPIAVLKGSANLTYSGAGRNEEIIDHFFYDTQGYDQVRANVDDTFHGAEAWEP